MQYLLKIISTIINLCFNLIIGIVLPRFLGPTQFGKYEFINNLFSNTFSFLDFGLSNYYYTNLSRNPSNKELIKKYLMYVCFIACVILISCIIVANSSLDLKKLLNIDHIIFYYAIVFAFLTWVLNIYRYSYDALNLTIIGEKAWIIYKFSALIGLLFLLLNNYSNLEYIYFKDIIVMIIILIFYSIIIKKKLNKVTYSDIKTEFPTSLFAYIRPLFFLSFINLIASSIDRIILNKFSLPEEQGYFSLAFRVSQIGIIFSGSVIQLIHRSFSITNDEIQNKAIIEREASFMFVITTLISLVIYFNSGYILQLFGGDKYNQALPALSIIALYPIHQIYGQIASTFLLSQSLTKIYTIINFFSLILGLVLLWFFLAPSHLYGLHMQSYGLALKMVISGFISTNISMFVVFKSLKMNFKNFIYFQFKIIIISFIVGQSVSIGLAYLIKNNILFFILNSSIFLIAMMAIFFIYNSFFNLNLPIIQKIKSLNYFMSKK